MRAGADLPGTGRELSAQAVANYIAKYATKTIGASGFPDQPVRGPAAIAALRCSAHYKRLISVCWELGKDHAAAQLALNRWTHMLGYRGHFLTKSHTLLRHLHQAAPGPHHLPPRPAAPDGEKDPWGRDLDERIVLIAPAWQYVGTGHATTAERELALAAAARAREHDRIAREEAWMN